MIKYLLYFVFLIPAFVSGQSTSEKLKQEQKRLEKNIANTKSLLDQTQNNQKSTFNELQLIENQIKYREDLLRNYDNQIRGADLKIKERQTQIVDLTERIEKLKQQYSELLVYAYKHRNKYGGMMYVFSAEDYHEAQKRSKYLEKIKEIQQKQFLVIQQHKELIAKEIELIELEKGHKLVVIDQKKAEREDIAKDRVLKQELYDKFKGEADELSAKLRKEEAQRAELKSRIDAAIKKEIAEAEAKRKREEEARRKAEAAKAASTNSGTASTTTAPSTTKPESSFESTKEVAMMSASFEENRGKLPWPVEKGTITEGYGKNPHPTLENVFTNNNGVDIAAPKNAQVRAVFNGEVTSVLNIPGAGKVVIVKHGNYRTVYSNLQNAYVNKGAKVTTKQVIGSLLVKDGESVSTAHFEIHQVVGTLVNSLNPSLWIAK